MTAKQKAEGARGAISLFILAAPLVVGAFFSVDGSWGWDHLHRVPVAIPVLLFVVSLLLALPLGRKSIGAVFDRGGAIQRRFPFASAVVLSLLGLICFLLWPIATRMYGDSLYYLENYSAEHSDAYLDALLNVDLNSRGRASFLLHDLVARTFGWSFGKSYQVVSALAGAGFLFAVVRMAGTLPRIGDWTRSAIVWLALTDAANQLFFGHIENYSLPRLFGALFLIGVVRSLLAENSTRTRFLPLLWFFLAVFFHAQALVFFPTLLLWLAWELRERFSVFESVLTLRSVLLGLCLTFLLALIGYLGVGSFSYDYIYSGGRPSFQQLFLPLRTSELGMPYLKYTLFSLPHIVDLFGSLYSISSPAILLVLVLLLRKSRLGPRFLVLLPALVLAGLHNFILNPAIGFSFDWDLMSVLSLPLLFIAVLLLAQEERPKEWLLFGIVVLGLSTSTIHWVNASEPRVRQRVEDMGVWLHQTYYGGSHYRLSANHSSLQDLTIEADDRRRVLGRLAAHAYEEDREVAFLWEKLARLEVERGQYELALVAYRNSVQYDDTQWPRLKPLGYLETEVGNLAAGIRTLKKYLETNPRDGEAWLLLADANARSGDLRFAMEGWETFLELSPSDPEAPRVRVDLASIREKTK